MYQNMKNYTHIKFLTPPSPDFLPPPPWCYNGDDIFTLKNVGAWPADSRNPFINGIMKDSIWVACQTPNFLVPKSALPEERHFAVLCHDKTRWFSGSVCAANLKHPDVFSSNVGTNTYNNFYTVLKVLCSTVPHLVVYLHATPMASQHLPMICCYVTTSTKLVNIVTSYDRNGSNFRFSHAIFSGAIHSTSSMCLTWDSLQLRETRAETGISCDITEI
jgi:hypothetical protein